MKLADQTAQLIIAALLMLVVSLAWLPIGADGFEAPSEIHNSGVVQALGGGAHHHDGPDQVVGSHYACEHCGIDCCSMTHCHPALTTESCDTLFSDTVDKARAPAGADVIGGSPDVAIPPPRLLLV